MRFHEVANIFPLMQGEEFDTLCQDIEAKGLIEDIWLHPDGDIIDGRNRYRACQEVGIDPRFRTWNGDGSLVGFVLSLNLHRRHLTSGQRAALAVEVEPMFAEEAKERQRLSEGRGKKGEEIFPHLKGNQVKPREAQARDQAAKALNTNGRYVSDMKRIKRDAPEVFEQVKTGEITITEAKQQVTSPNRPMKPKSNQPGDLYSPKGYDACQTPAYALDPLLPFLNRDWLIWEPAAGEKHLTEALRNGEFGDKKVIASDILTGENFFEFEPPKWSCLVTNPPYSIKYQWLERCYQLGKPFALLVPVEILGAKTAQEFLKQYGFEIMLLNRRVDFKMPNKGWENSSAQFPVLWLCWQILPEKVMFGEIKKNGQ